MRSKRVLHAHNSFILVTTDELKASNNGLDDFKT